MMRLLLLFILFIYEFRAGAQPVRELKIGDTLPSIDVLLMTKGETKNVRLSSLYHSKFLIIDFWASWCGACIRAIRDGDSVAKAFGEKIKLVPVTYENSQVVEAFIKNNPLLRQLDIDYVVGDSLLMGGYFTFDILPHQVWVDSLGVVKAIGYPDEMTSGNLRDFISCQTLNIEEKRDEIDFDYSKPLATGDSSLLYRSVLTPYKTGLMNMIGSFSKAYVKDQGMDRFLVINKDILSIFYAIFSQSQGNISMNRVELHIRDSMALSPYLMQNFPNRKMIKKYSYCYEMILPDKKPIEEFYRNLLSDLNRLFPFTATMEKRKKACWVIVNRQKHLNPGRSNSSDALIWQNGFIKRLCNQTMDVLTNYLDKEMDSVPVVDRTGFKTSFDLDIDVRIEEGSRFFDIGRIQKSLREKGFDLIRSKQMVDVLVIREKKARKPGRK